MKTELPKTVDDSQKSVELPCHQPRGVTFLTSILLLFVGLNLMRTIHSVRTWQFLTTLPGVSPPYLVLSGLVGCLVGLPLAWGVWRGQPWARPAVYLLLPLYSLYFWIDRLALAGYAWRNFDWPFALGVNVLLVGWSAWYLRRPLPTHWFTSPSQGNLPQDEKDPTGSDEIIG